jgi:large subunit ribosomal protein L25
MERVELQAASRTITGKKVKQLRNEGWVPAIMFGAEIESKSLQIEEKPLTKALEHAGTTALINLYLDEKPQPHVVLAREIQCEILSGRVQHVDFYQVQMGHKIKTTPALITQGESPLVKSGGAVLVQILTHVEVECLPGDLIDAIHIDISVLKRLDDSITVGDLQVPPGVTIITDPSDTVISIVPPRAAAEMEEPEEAVEAYAVEPGEEEAHAEGRAAAKE